MLFCCLQRNVEASCHKHFIVVFRHQQTPRLPATSVINLPWFVAAEYIAIGGRTFTACDGARYWLISRFLHNSPAFNAPFREGFPPEYSHDVWYGKTRMVWLPDVKKNLKMCLFISTEYTNARNGQTDGQWDGQTDERTDGLTDGQTSRDGISLAYA